MRQCDHSPRDASEELDHPNVRADEALLVLAVGELHEREARVTERRDEGIDGPVALLDPVVDQPHPPVIDLDLLAGVDFKAAGEGRIGLAKLLLLGAPEALEARIAGREAVFLLDDAEGRLRLERAGLSGDQLTELRPVVLELLLSRTGPRGIRKKRTKQIEELLPLRQWLLPRKTGLLGLAEIASNGLASKRQPLADLRDAQLRQLSCVKSAVA